MITKDNLIVHELIGLNVKVVSSISKPYEGISGRVVWETLNILEIEVGDGSRKKIPKKNTKFEFELDDGEKAIVNGSELLNKPENRLKRSIRKIK